MGCGALAAKLEAAGFDTVRSFAEVCFEEKHTKEDMENAFNLIIDSSKAEEVKLKPKLAGLLRACVRAVAAEAATATDPDIP